MKQSTQKPENIKEKILFPYGLVLQSLSSSIIGSQNEVTGIVIFHSKLTNLNIQLPVKLDAF
jgi:hypothetical protein